MEEKVAALEKENRRLRGELASYHSSSPVPRGVTQIQATPTRGENSSILPTEPAEAVNSYLRQTAASQNKSALNSAAPVITPWIIVGDNRVRYRLGAISMSPQLHPWSQDRFLKATKPSAAKAKKEMEYQPKRNKLPISLDPRYSTYNDIDSRGFSHLGWDRPIVGPLPPLTPALWDITLPGNVGMYLMQQAFVLAQETFWHHCRIHCPRVVYECFQDGPSMVRFETSEVL
jgi:hypothetical protein